MVKGKELADWLAKSQVMCDLIWLDMTPGQKLSCLSMWYLFQESIRGREAIDNLEVIGKALTPIIQEALKGVSGE